MFPIGTEVVTRKARVYFAVPDGYTIGKEFDTWTDAERYARSTIREFEGFVGRSRAFVDVRVVEPTVFGEQDHSIKRIEIL